MKKHSKADSGTKGKVRASQKSSAKLHHAENELQYRLEFGKLISSVSSKLVGFEPQQFKHVTELVLKKIGEFAGVDRGFIVLFSDSKANPQDIHVWRADGIANAHIVDRGFSFDSFPWALGKLKKLEHVRILSVQDLPSSAKAERDVFERFAVDSLLVIPVACESRLIGCLGFTSSNDKRMWDDDIIALLRMLGESFANAYERKKIEEHLRESEEKFRNLAEYSLQGIIILRDGRNLYVNRSLAEILETTVDDILGTRTEELLKEMVDPAYEGMVTALFRSRQKGVGVPPRYEIKIKSRKGNERWVEIFVTSITYMDEPALYGVVVDITDRKRAEEIRSALSDISETVIRAGNLTEMLKDTREIIGRLIDTAYFYVALYHADSENYTFPYSVDPHFQDRLPHSLEKTITDYVRRTGEPLIADQDVFQRLKSKGEIKIIKQCPKIWLGVPLRVSRGVIGVVTVQNFETATAYSSMDFELLTSVSGHIAMAIERIMAVDALAESEEKYRLLIENAGEGIFSVDYDGVFLVMNKTAAKYLDGEPEEFIGKTMWDLFPREISDRQMNSIRQTIRYNRRQVKEEMILVKGKERWFRTSIHPIYNSNGQATAAQLIAHDITVERRIDVRNAARMRLLDNLRNVKDIDQCLKYGCEALHDARLFKRAVLTLNDQDRRITHLGQIGLEDNLVSAAKNSPPLAKEAVKKIVREKYKISHSFFVPVEDSVNLEGSGRYIRQKKSKASGESFWQAGDELFVPIMGVDGEFEGWLSVDTPFDGERPSPHTVRFLEEVVDIVTQQIQEIQSREKLDLERQALKEKNIALNEVLAHIEEEKMAIKRQIAENIDETLLPILSKLKDGSGTKDPTYVDLLKSGLINLASASGGSQHVYSKLSTREREVCIMIRDFAKSTEIARALNITVGTVRKHRETIRRKLGLTNRKKNLAAYLNND